MENIEGLPAILNNSRSPPLTSERLLFATRKHWFVLVSPLISIFLIFLFLTGFLTILFAYNLISFFIFFSSLLLSVVLLATLATKFIVEWYFHLYLVTSRKILEIECKPLTSHAVNHVLLNQVRCTEVDARVNGLINELVDMGDVTVTFDRPTHYSAFIIANIKNPRRTGLFLGQILDAVTSEQNKSFWYKQKDSQEDWNYTEEILPKFRFGPN